MIPNELEWKERCIEVVGLSFILSYSIHILSRHKFVGFIFPYTAPTGKQASLELIDCDTHLLLEATTITASIDSLITHSFSYSDSRMAYMYTDAHHD